MPSSFQNKGQREPASRLLAAREPSPWPFFFRLPQKRLFPLLTDIIAKVFKLWPRLIQPQLHPLAKMSFLTSFMFVHTRTHMAVPFTPFTRKLESNTDRPDTYLGVE